MKSIKAILAKVFFELIVITFGVLIALGINAWYNTYQQQQQASQLLTKIAYELENNITQLARVQAGYEQNIELADKFEAELQQNPPTEESYQFVLMMLHTDQGAWQFSKSRDELNTLPVELLIDLNLANRSSLTAQNMVSDFIFQQHDEISKLLENDQNEAYLDTVEREFKQLKFTIDIALLSSQKALSRIKEFQKTGKLTKNTQPLSLSSEL